MKKPPPEAEEDQEKRSRHLGQAPALLEYAAACFDFIRCGPGLDVFSEKQHKRIKQMYKPRFRRYEP